MIFSVFDNDFDDDYNDDNDDDGDTERLILGFTVEPLLHQII